MYCNQQLRLYIRIPANIRKFLEENKAPYPRITYDGDLLAGEQYRKDTLRKITWIGQIESKL